MMLFENKTYDEERALYGLRDAQVRNCLFEGPADGESALKECRSIAVEDCRFHLRYPFWHVEDARVIRCELSEGCRAALWYDHALRIEDCKLNGIKALRECASIHMKGCTAVSTEFGWKCRDLTLENCQLTGEYPFLESTGLVLDGFTLHGKYSFQYVRGAVIRNSNLQTKDAFWHAKDVTVVDSVVSGEYLGWYSENLKLIRCHISGTQPLCYCKGLVLEDCTMEGCDLSFENSDVVATVNGSIDSVKNPVHGSILADRIGETILDEYRRAGADCTINTRE